MIATHNVAIKVKGGETVLVKKAAANSLVIQNAYFTHDNQKKLMETSEI
jgi:hypothetical protein